MFTLQTTLPSVDLGVEQHLLNLHVRVILGTEMSVDCSCSNYLLHHLQAAIIGLAVRHVGTG